MHRLIRRAIPALAHSALAGRPLGLLAAAIVEANEAESGSTPTRTLYQMRIPRDGLAIGAPRHAATRPYQSGRDDDTLLALIDRAFGWHPDEQWDTARLTHERSIAGFEPGDVLLCFADTTLVGFSWTRLHDDRDVKRGEIMMVGVDPGHAGRGLGRALTEAGLDRLWHRGADHAFLYVDSTNRRAVKLYVDMGFTVHRVERRFGQRPLIVP